MVVPQVESEIPHPQSHVLLFCAALEQVQPCVGSTNAAPHRESCRSSWWQNAHAAATHPGKLHPAPPQSGSATPQPQSHTPSPCCHAGQVQGEPGWDVLVVPMEDVTPPLELLEDVPPKDVDATPPEEDEEDDEVDVDDVAPAMLVVLLDVPATVEVPPWLELPATQPCTRQLERQVWVPPAVDSQW